MTDPTAAGDEATMMRIRDLTGYCLRFDAFISMAILIISVAYRLFIKRSSSRIWNIDLDRNTTRTFLIAAAFLASLEIVLAIASVVRLFFVIQNQPSLQDLFNPLTAIYIATFSISIHIIHRFHRRRKSRWELHLSRMKIAGEIFDIAITLSSSAMVTAWLWASFTEKHTHGSQSPDARPQIFASILVLSIWTFILAVSYSAILWTLWLWQCVLPIWSAPRPRYRNAAHDDTEALLQHPTSAPPQSSSPHSPALPSNTDTPHAPSPRPGLDLPSSVPSP